jgi:hypothetical protein
MYVNLYDNVMIIEYVQENGTWLVIASHDVCYI